MGAGAYHGRFREDPCPSRRRRVVLHRASAEPARPTRSRAPAPAPGRVGAPPEVNGRRVRRSLRWLKRIAIALLVLLVIGVAAFTWFAYWPLEGKVERIDALVPGAVDFVWRASWPEIKEQGAVARWLVDDPPIQSLSASKMK